MRLINVNGSPIGIYFKKHNQNANSYLIRVTGKGQQTDIGADPENMAECFEKAIDKRLELLGIPDDAESWQTLASSYGAFLDYYGIEIVTATHLEFKLKEK